MSFGGSAGGADDGAVIGRVLRGARDDFRILVLRYQDLVYAMIYRQVGSAAEAEELAQEVFVKAYLNLGRFRGQSAFATWLTRIALNHTSTYFSSRRFRNAVRSESFDAAIHSPPAGDPEERGIGRETVERFRAALARLKPKFRDTLVLCGLEEKSYEEAAAILGIPVGTVRSRLSKARALMRRYMGDEEMT